MIIVLNKFLLEVVASSAIHERGHALGQLATSDEQEENEKHEQAADGATDADPRDSGITKRRFGRITASI